MEETTVCKNWKDFWLQAFSVNKTSCLIWVNKDAKLNVNCTDRAGGEWGRRERSERGRGGGGGGGVGGRRI